LITDIQPLPTCFTKRVVSLVISALPIVCSVIGCAGDNVCAKSFM